MKSKFRSLIDAASLKPNSTELMIKITEELDELMCDLEEAHPALYWDAMHELHILVNGAYFDLECVEYATSMMKNSDGTTGRHWNLDETNSVAVSSSIVMDRFNQYDWNYVMNMMYSDHYASVGDNVTMYASLAKEWLNDIDAPDGKAFIYWKTMKSYAM